MGAMGGYAGLANDMEPDADQKTITMPRGQAPIVTVTADDGSSLSCQAQPGGMTKAIAEGADSRNPTQTVRVESIGTPNQADATITVRNATGKTVSTRQVHQENSSVQRECQKIMGPTF